MDNIQQPCMFPTQLNDEFTYTHGREMLYFKFKLKSWSIINKITQSCKY